VEELRRQLRDGDPLARESGLSAADADAIRRLVMDAADQASVALWLTKPRADAREGWPHPLFLAATVAATIIVGVVVGARLSSSDARNAGSNAIAGTSGVTTVAERRQLQFATPGGTRIIWVFDPEFNP
jgi:hypothetical protein